MQTKTINLYSFDELSEEAKKKAIDRLSDINTDYEWWDGVYDNFHHLCKLIGVDVDLKKTFFSLSYSQGDGSSFKAEVDVIKLLTAIKSESFREEFPQLKISFNAITENIVRAGKLINAGLIDSHVTIGPSNRESSVKVASYYNYYPTKCTRTPNLDKLFVELEDFMDDVASTLNHLLFTWLREECEYLTSEEAIIETIKANDYTFTIDGKLENL